MAVQLALGAATVLAGVPLWLAVLHQLVGVLVAAAAIACAFVLRAPPSALAVLGLDLAAPRT
jgi:heme A synthase